MLGNMRLNARLDVSNAMLDGSALARRVNSVWIVHMVKKQPYRQPFVLPAGMVFMRLPNQVRASVAKQEPTAIRQLRVGVVTAKPVRWLHEVTQHSVTVAQLGNIKLTQDSSNA